MAKKVTFILGSMAGGGAERVISNLSEYYCTMNYDVNIITLLNDQVDYDLPDNVSLKYISTDKNRGISKVVKWVTTLRKILIKEKPDIVISFFAKINILVLLASILLKVPIFLSERNDPKLDNRGFVVKYLTYLLYPLSKGIIFQTKHAQACFPKYIQRKSTIIPNPINVKYDFSSDKKLNHTIISVGKLMEQKNHKLLIEAFASIANKYPDFKLKIYGEGVLRYSLLKLISEKNLEGRILLMGREPKIFNAIYNADLFVLSSNYEGLSNSLLEAMALETPVISTNCAGSNELIIDYKTGRIVNKNDSKALSSAIEFMINNYEEAKSMAKRAKKTVSGFSLISICKKWDSFTKI
ncbi:hypothetical protein OBCHQ24_15510 [Oceanobacillus iheyensis]|nr:hypothetical protein OBCHQ24_15510 [Oceanobacillus iheyensis]